MRTAEGPKLEDRGERHYVAIPAVTSLTGLPAVVPALLPRVYAWLAARGIAPAGPPLVRYLVIDMPLRLEVEIAVPTAGAVPGDGHVRAGDLPAGRYATLVHTGPVEGLAAANAALQEWVGARGLVCQSHPVGSGTAWGARTESFLTNPGALEHRTELAYLLAEARAG